MKIIRGNVFETNSSSTHTLTICTKEEFEKWKDGKLILNRSENKMVPIPDYSEAYLRELFFKDRARELANGYVYDNKYYKSLQDIVNDPEVSISQDELDEYKYDWSLESYTAYMENVSEGMEYSEVSYTSPGGDELVGFGYGGYDG